MIRVECVDDSGRTRELRPLFWYCAAGAAGTAVHFAVLFAALRAVGPVPASTLGAIAGCVINYFLATTFVFRHCGVSAGAFARFACVAACGVAVNAIVLSALLGALPVALSQAAASVVVLLLGYSINKSWTFDARSN